MKPRKPSQRAEIQIPSIVHFGVPVSLGGKPGALRNLTVCGALALTLLQSVSAATNTWTGTTNGAWGTTTNWSQVAGFTNGDDVVFGATGLNQNIQFLGGADRTVKSITIGGTAVSSIISFGSQFAAGGTARNLTFNATNTGITIASGNTANHAIGVSAAGTGGFILAGNLLVTHNGSGTLTIARPISGGFAVTKTGTGTLAFSALHTFSGQLTVQQGTLSVDAINNASSNGRLGNSASSVILGSTSTTGTLQYTATTDNTNKKFTLATNGTGAFDVNATGGTLTLSGVIDGTSGSLSKVGVGTLILSGANTYTGTTTLTTGTLQANVATVASTSSAFGNGGDITFAGGTLQYGANAAGVNADFGSRIKNSASVMLFDTQTNNVTIATNIGSTNTAGLTKSAGTGILTLSGANTYTGVTTVSAGTLQLGKPSSLYNNVTSSWTAANITVGVNSTLSLNVGGAGEFTSSDVDMIKGLGTDMTGFVSSSFLGFDTTNAGGEFIYASSIDNTNATLNNLGVKKFGTGFLTLTANNPFAGGLTINAGMVAAGHNNALGSSQVTCAGGGLSSDGSTPRTIANPVLISAATILGDSVKNGTLTFSSQVNLGGAARTITTNSNVVFDAGAGAGSISIKSGLGTLTLRGANTWASNTFEIQDGAFVLDGSLTSIDSFRVSTHVVGGTTTATIASGATMTVTTSSANLRLGLTGGDTSLTTSNIFNVSGSVVLSNAVGAVGGKIVIGQANTNGTLNLKPGGSISLKSVLEDTSTGISTVNLDGGTLKALQNDAAFINSNLDVANIQAGGVTIDSNSFDISAMEPLLHDAALGATADGGLNKVGSGTLTLAATTPSTPNTYTGPTTVTNGTLCVAGELDAASTVTLVSGTTLSGNGIIHGSVSGTGTISPGANSAEELNVGPTSVTGTLAIDINDFVFDKLKSSGTLDVTGMNLTINLQGLGFTEPNYIIAEGTSIVGPFASVPSGYQVDIVSGGVGQQAVLTATASNYGTWASTNSVTGTKTDDDDKDGINNLMEYALGLNPHASSVPAGSLSGDVVTFNKGSEAITNGDVTFIIQESDDLGMADPWADVVTQTPPDASPTISHTLSAGAKKFARLKVLLTP